ncbi:MAG: DUF166 family protein [Methanobacterium sp.]
MVKISCENDKIAEIQVLRTSPCGSTLFVADEMIGQDLKDLPIKTGLKLQHYTCRASQIRLITGDECKKELASNFHKTAFEEALK